MDAEDLALLSAFLDTDAPDSSGLSGDIEKNEVGSAPLSFAQRRLWFLEQMNPETSTYHIPFAFTLDGPLDLNCLNQAIDQIVARHTALQSVFETTGGEPQQRKVASTSFNLSEEDLSCLNPLEIKARVSAQIEAISQKSFKLDQWPLFRGHVMRTAPNSQTVIFVLHHMISDGWSTGIFIRELMNAYQALILSEPRQLPALTHQYFDYAIWQKNSLERGALKEQLAFWEQQLRGLQDLPLPTDFPRPRVQSTHGNSLPISLPSTILPQIQELLRTEGATPFMLLLSAYAWTLSRYTNTTDIAIGTPVAGRNRKEFEPLIGFFVNTVPLRIDTKACTSFRSLLKTVKAVTLESLAHADIPFELLVEKLKPSRNLSHHPLVQVIFTLDQASKDLRLQDLTLKPIPHEAPDAKFDLSLSFQESANTFVASIIYNTSLFTRDTIQAFADAFTHTLEQFVTAPDSLINRDHTLPASHQNIYKQWSIGKTTEPQPEDSVLQQIERRTVENPNKVAVSTAHSQLTYRELSDNSHQLTKALAKVDLSANQPVAVILPRSADWITSQLAIWKAGAAWVSMDHSHPTERLRQLIQESQPGAIITTAEIAATLNHGESPVLVVSELIATPQIPSEHLTETTLCPQSPAYLIFTSGSTGKPKSVVVPHSALTNLIAWHIKRFNLSPDSKATQVASAAFDASVWEVWPYLAAGATIHIPGPEIIQAGPTPYINWIIEKAITHSFAPTPLAESLIETPWPSQARLKFLLTGGDRLRKYPLEGLPFEFVNNYGPTENTVVTTSTQISPNTAATPHLPLIGHPIDNCSFYVLNRDLDPVPVGSIGELYIGGRSLASHYNNLPEQTALAFIPHPCSKEPGARMYKTGDKVRLGPDGSLSFIGREDHQIKIRGHRIELGEIEQAILSYPAIAEAVVEPFTSEGAASDHQILTAYIVPRTQGTSLSDLKRFLAEKLPVYMLPTRYVELPALPLNSSGKVDRKALPRPSNQRPQLQNIFVAPTTPTERTIAHIWQSHLQLEKVGIHDNIFDLGGHSMMLLKLQKDLEDQSLASVRIVDLFSNPTIQELARFIDTPNAPAKEIAVEAFQTRKEKQKAAFKKRQDKAQNSAENRTKPTTDKLN